MEAVGEDGGTHLNDDMQEDEGFSLFKNRQARGTLYKLSPMTDDTKSQMTEYVHGGSMMSDLRYAREIYGLINTSGRRDFSYVWESPWVEEHIRDTAKKRKIENQQRSMAVRTFLKASSSHEADNIEKFLANVDTLTKWEDKYDSKEDVKTISRVIQSFERVAVRNIWAKCETLKGSKYVITIAHLKRLQQNEQRDASSIANALRRSSATFDLFANLVATEINWADSTNGTKNMSIYMNKQLEQKKEDAIMKIMHLLESLKDNAIEKDVIGNPLMNVNFNICVSHGILVVGSPGNNAMYVLDIEGNKNADGFVDLKGVKVINIVQTISEEITVTNSAATRP